jgi:hypothetical protein
MQFSNRFNYVTEGKVSGGVNSQGVKFYNDLINELLSNGKIPFFFFFQLYIFFSNSIHVDFFQICYFSNNNNN